MNYRLLLDDDVQLGRGLCCVDVGKWRAVDHEEGDDVKPALCAKSAEISIIKPEERDQAFELVDKLLANQSVDWAQTWLIHSSFDSLVHYKDCQMALGVLEVAQRIVEDWGKKEIIEPSDSNFCIAPAMVKRYDSYF